MNQENTGLDKTMLKKFAAGGTVELKIICRAARAACAHGNKG